MSAYIGDPYLGWAGAEKRLENAMDTISELRDQIAALRAENERLTARLQAAEGEAVLDAGVLFVDYYMNKNGLWPDRLEEVKAKGYDDASPIARLVYSCEIGNIDQHASEDIKMISAALLVGYDLEARLQSIAAALQAEGAK